MIRCCKEGCKASPAKGDRFYRVWPWPERVWVCHEHFGDVEMEKEMAILHTQYNSFFQKEKPQ